MQIFSLCLQLDQRSPIVSRKLRLEYIPYSGLIGLSGGWERIGYWSTCRLTEISIFNFWQNESEERSALGSAQKRNLGPVSTGINDRVESWPFGSMA